MLTKSDPGAGSTGYAQGGIAAAVGPDDSPELHAADTIAAGDGSCDEAAVRVLVEQGPRYVRELEAWGAAFDRQPDGSLDLAREGAHSVRRVLHAHDATGREIGRVLAARLCGSAAGDGGRSRRSPCRPSSKTGRVAGVRFLDARGDVGEARARATLLATGGAGQVYRETTNPPVATGDGVALAYLAGARDRRHGVRPVPSDGARRARRAAVSAVGSAARRRRAARQRPRRSRSCRATIRRAISRRAIAWRAPSCANPSARARRCT